MKTTETGRSLASVAQDSRMAFLSSNPCGWNDEWQMIITWVFGWSWPKAETVWLKDNLKSRIQGSLRQSFYAFVDCIDVWFQSLKMQNVAFWARRKIPFEYSKRSFFSFELELMSIFVYFNGILWFNITLQKRNQSTFKITFDFETRSNTYELSSHLKM